MTSSATGRRRGCGEGGHEIEKGLELGDAVFGGGVEVAEVGRAGESEGDGHDANEGEGGAEGDDGGGGLGGTIEPVMRVPDGPDVEGVGSPAGDDEGAEHQENRREGDVAAVADEVKDQEGNRIIGERDEAVGDDMEFGEGGIPEMALAVGHEGAAAQFLKPVFHRGGEVKEWEG